MRTDILEKIGLSRAETRVYLALLQLGSAPSSRIVQETELRKSTVYESIRRLQVRGLASFVIKDGIKYFEAASPESILDFIREQKRILDDTEREAASLVKQLRRGFDTLKPHAEAHVLAGVEGFKAMRRDVLRNARGEHMLIGAISREDEVMPDFFRWWNRERMKKRIRLRILHKASARDKAMAKRAVIGKYFETRFLPEEIESPAVINVYGDRVVDVLWKQRYPLCFMLINREIADAYRKYFEYLWRTSSRT